jgi:hypothetical protein
VNIILAESKTYGVFPTIVDAEDLWIPLVMPVGVWRSRKGVFYPTVSIGSASITLHKFLVYCPENYVIDHVNRNTLDCRKQNLRVTTYSQNRLNAKIHADNTSTATGVYSSGSKTSPWGVKVGSKYIGSFKTLGEAISARNKAIVELNLK